MVVSVEARKEQKTVKAFKQDIALINEQARRLGCTAAEVIHGMCEEMRKQVYLKDLGESLDSVIANADQFAALHAENKAWDCALSDGLDHAT